MKVFRITIVFVLVSLIALTFCACNSKNTVDVTGTTTAKITAIEGDTFTFEIGTLGMSGANGAPAERGDKSKFAGKMGDDTNPGNNSGDTGDRNAPPSDSFGNPPSDIQDNPPADQVFPGVPQGSSDFEKNENTFVSSGLTLTVKTSTGMFTKSDRASFSVGDVVSIKLAKGVVTAIVLVQKGASDGTALAPEKETNPSQDAQQPVNTPPAPPTGSDQTPPASGNAVPPMPSGSAMMQPIEPPSGSDQAPAQRP